MRLTSKIYAEILLLLALISGLFFFLLYQVNNSVGEAQEAVYVEIEKGENFVDVGKKLSQKGVISNYTYFSYYVWKEGLGKKIVAGTYEFQPGLKIPEVVEIIIRGRTSPPHVVVTIPEGWTIEDISQKLSSSGFDGESFLSLAQDPTADFVSQFEFLKGLPREQSLEGYLFPDTYFFFKDASSEDIIVKMLKNFNSKLSEDFREAIEKNDNDIHEIITLASIIETEVSSSADRKIVSGIFKNRLEIGMALQSDATVAYVLEGDRKAQHDADDISIDSPYNTYKYPGLPPGPISNPGLAAIEATIYPQETDYMYFLNNPQTGETFFAETFEQHIQNKANNGL